MKPYENLRFSYLWSHPWLCIFAHEIKPLQNLPLVINLSSLSQLIQTSFGFYSNYFPSQINSENYFEPKWFSKQVPYCIWVLTSNQLSWIVLCTHNPEPSWSTPFLFKIFKIQPLQVWTRFAKFDEIHIYTPPKIPPKFRQPTWAMRSHSTKFELKEKHLDANFIVSNTSHALLLCKI